MDKYEVVGSLGLDSKVVAVVGGGANNGIGRADRDAFR